MYDILFFRHVNNMWLKLKTVYVQEDGLRRTRDERCLRLVDVTSGAMHFILSVSNYFQ